MSDEPVRRRLSFLRLFLALLIVAGAATGVWALVTHRIDKATAADSSLPLAPTWFGPYVDLTAAPTYQFQDPQYDPAKQVVLGFVVASGGAGCTPAWGGTYSMGQAAVSLDLDRRVVQYRERGDAIVLSFGGPVGEELAATCQSESSLVDAYLSVIRHYQVSAVDFDLEGGALSPAAVELRSSALAAVQHQLAGSGTKLEVWLTVPGASDGITAQGRSALAAALAAHLGVAGVNVAAMNLVTGGRAPAALLPAIEAELQGAERQVASIYDQAGLSLDSAHIWNRLGGTVMIGQSMVPGEQLTVLEAQKLATFAVAHRMGRLSMWTLNRDTACGTYYAELGVVSDDCSGVEEATLGFSEAFVGLSGTVAGPPMTFAPVVSDNPATSPYPIWEAQQTYQGGYKVVWQGEVYQAKWSSTGSPPDTSVQYAYQTPWLLVGPVLPTDRAPVITRLRPGTDPAWSPKATYSAGARVLWQGLPYQAKWFNVADQPGADPTDPASSPWQPLFTVPGEPTVSP